MTTEKRVWLRGKLVRGFFGGLLFALRAHFGSAYRVEVGEGKAAVVEGPPPPPEPVAEA